MAKKILKAILKYPIIVVNRICIWIYFKTRKNNETCEKITPRGNERILVLSPHVDDETIGLGGSLIRYSISGAKLDLVYLTDGSGSTSYKSKEETIKERMEEGYKVRDSYGFQNVYFLEKVDGFLDSGDLDLINKLVDIFKKEKPNIIFSPFLIDGNTDHVETTKALHKALEIWDDSFENIYLYQVNTLIEPQIVNAISLLDKKVYEEKVEKFHIFQSQWAMGFSIFHLLDRGRALMYKGSHGVEAFVRLNYQRLEEIIQIIQSKGFNPYLFKQISSEFTLLTSFMKSRKSKIRYNELVKDIMANQELGGKPFRAS